MKKSKTSCKKAAFTLAETLIAIGIIGVVSALIIPNLVKNYQQRQTIVKLKKVYALLSQTMRASVDDNGDVDDWDFTLSEEEFMTKYFAPYIKISKIDGVVHKYKNLAGANAGALSLYYALPDGAYVYQFSWKHFIMKNHFVVDINGASGPNRYGRDVFIFTFWDNKLIPYSQYSPGSIKALCSSWHAKAGNSGSSGQCTKTSQGGFGAGSYCSTVIFCNNWTIPKGYPWN
jgi:type II secretory pathway pseudopilin PulG